MARDTLLNEVDSEYPLLLKTEPQMEQVIRPDKQLSNAISTGGGGAYFEACVQAMFVTLMLTGGFAPCLPNWPITRILLQGRVHGFETDDVIVHVKDPSRKLICKLAAQVKLSIRITKGDKDFGEVMQAAWNDFNNTTVFNKEKDIIALITGPLSATDTNDVAWVLNLARHTHDADEFSTKVNRARFTSRKKRAKLNAFKHQLTQANQGREIADECLHSFLKCFHLLGYDLGKEVGVVLSLLHSHMSQYGGKPLETWHGILSFVQTRNQSAGIITPDSIPEYLQEAFKPKSVEVIPSGLSVGYPSSNEPDWNRSPHAADLAIASLVGAWNESNDADREVIRRIASS